MPSKSNLHANGGGGGVNNSRGEQNVMWFPGINQDRGGQMSAPIFYLICDKKLRRTAVCLFVCFLSVYPGVGFILCWRKGERLTRQLTRSESEGERGSKRPLTEWHANGTNLHSQKWYFLSWCQCRNTSKQHLTIVGYFETIVCNLVTFSSCLMAKHLDSFTKTPALTDSHWKL